MGREEADSDCGGGVGGGVGNGGSGVRYIGCCGNGCHVDVRSGYVVSFSVV